jgi:hemolysin activation/secretion protein
MPGFSWVDRKAQGTLGLLFFVLTLSAARAQNEGSFAADGPPPVPALAASPADVTTNTPKGPTFYIKEYRVVGSHLLSRTEIEEAVYPYMGPERSPDDVEQARGALEKVIQGKGYGTVSVQIPQQTGKRGIVFLQVVEAKVGRLNVEGSRFFTLDAIKKGVPSLAPGTVPNFNQVSTEIMSLNKWGDRQVTPAITPGVEPGTMDVTLNVKDTFPLHGSAEYNNRYSPNTVPYRFNIAASYDNLWQLGHSIGGSFQVAPQNPSEAESWNVFYTARFPRIDWLRLNLSYSSQSGNVSTLSGSASTSPGQTAAFRFLAALPSEQNFSQSLSAGIDFKYLNQTTIGPNSTVPSPYGSTPLSYWPIRVNYTALWTPKDSTTIFDAGISFGIRGAQIGTNGTQSNYDNLRYNSDGGFFVLSGDLSHTHDLPGGFQLYGKVQGQVSPNPLVYSEQYSGGGLDTCRGYLESTQVGDNGVFGSAELRSPSLLQGHAGVNEWRVYAFLDGGTLTLNDALPGQTSAFNFAAYGAGSRLRMYKDLNGSIDIGVPMISEYPSDAVPILAGSVLVTFRLFGEF